MTKIDTIFLRPFEAGHTYMADIREYLPQVGQSQRDVWQVNTFQSASLWQLSGISAAQNNAFAQISPHPGTSDAKNIKIPAFLRL